MVLYYKQNDTEAGSLSRSLRGDLLDAEAATRPALEALLVQNGLDPAPYLRKSRVRACLNQYGLLTGCRGAMPFCAAPRACLPAFGRRRRPRRAARPPACRPPPPAGPALPPGPCLPRARACWPPTRWPNSVFCNDRFIKEQPHGRYPKISIITSVYNAEDYLERTVRSILAQTFTDFELLLVDDGSPDSSGALCDELAKTDARIRVFHQENGGPAHASNTGLDNARGDYVGFVDCDDLIEPTMYEKLYAAVHAPGVRLAACTGDCIDEQDRTIQGRLVAIREHGIRDAQELLLETFQTGSFTGR